MHLLPTILLPLLTLTTAYTPTAFDAAIFNQTLPDIEARGHYGWVASFATTDVDCKGGYGGARPKIRGKCVPFVPLQTRVKIDWGTGPLGFNHLSVFSDGDCKDKIRVIDRTHNDDCVDTMGRWGSVKWFDPMMGGGGGF